MAALPGMTLDEARQRATLTVPEAASLVGISTWAGYEWAKRGELPTVRVGRRLLVPAQQLLKMLGADAA